MVSLLELFASSMGHVGQAVERDFERQQIEEVFGLTGGELNNKPLNFRAAGVITGNMLDFSWRYHYDGFPEWAEQDFSHPYDSEFFTLVEIGVSYQSSAPESITFEDGKTWVRVRQYTHSGECDCPLGPNGNNETVGEDSTEGLQECPLCEEKKGKKHTYIYTGTGVESVYKHTEFACSLCHMTRQDLLDDILCCLEDSEEADHVER